MGRAPTFRFETAPELPGADTISRYGFGGIRRLTHRLWDLTIEGAENVPRTGSAIITPNHLSFCDSVFVPAALPRRVWAIGKGEYMDSWKTKHLFPAMGMIPVDRSGGDAAKAALDTAATVLDGGHLFMIYPEGTRSRSGNLHKGRTGAARLAARCDAPIIPVGHSGTLAIQPPDTFMMKPNLPCTVRFGEPMRAEDFGDPADPRVLRVFTDAVMFEIGRLSGQSYVDTYAGKSDTPAGAGPSPSSSGDSPDPAATGITRPAAAPVPSIPTGRPSPAPSPVIDLRSGGATPATASGAASTT
jgi:1-acyl-sn-glycerol-3-phosphate acyltransferase